MAAMISDRSDWCISRQRSWGVPIPIFYCKECGKELVTDESIAAVSALFRREGSDAWYQHEADEILPEGTVCPVCGCKHFTKETNILDVWFDSGCSHASVLDQRPELGWPCELYLEGNDQLSRWFSRAADVGRVGAQSRLPSRSAPTAGWWTARGKEMHKSAGTPFSSDDIIKKLRADILRCGRVAGLPHRRAPLEGKSSSSSPRSTAKSNTRRFMLANLSGLQPDTDSVCGRKRPRLTAGRLSRSTSWRKCRTYSTVRLPHAYHASTVSA